MTDKLTCIHGYQVHPVANIVPMATELEQEALKLSIKKNGQLDPIILFREKIVDGRCRALACQDLKIDVLVERLPHKTSISELKAIAMSKNTRRNLTASQKAISAVRAYKDESNSETQETIILTWGTDKNSFFAALWVQSRQPIYNEILEKGESVKLQTISGVWITTKSIQKVAQELKRIEEKMKKKQRDYSLDLNSAIITEEAKSVHKSFIDSLEETEDGNGFKKESVMLNFIPFANNSVEPIDQEKVG